MSNRTNLIFRGKVNPWQLFSMALTDPFHHSRYIMKILCHSPNKKYNNARTCNNRNSKININRRYSYIIGIS